MSYFSEKKGRTPSSYKIVHNSDFVLAHQLFATMSSGKFKKRQAPSKKAIFHSDCPIFVHVFCIVLFDKENYNVLCRGVKWIM